MAFDRSLLARATEGTDAPTPGYLYLDLAKAASANPSAAAEMASYLTKRLSSKANPNIKAKCCKVIAKLCEQVNHFRRCLTQDPSSVAAIKEAMAFRGALDPVQGDAKNEKVRQAAKEALDAVYSESAPSTISSSYAPSPHMSSGLGSASAAGPRRMEGIGNPRYQDPRMEGPPSASGNKVADAVQEAGSVILGMIKDPLARNVDVGPPRQGHSGNLPGYGSHQATYGRPPPGATELSRQTGGQWTMASNRGPGAIQNNEYYKTAWNKQDNVYDRTPGSVGGSWANAAPAPSNYGTPSITIQSTGAPSAPLGQAVSDGSYEKNLIMELCPPGGMKPVPPPDKLAHFSQTCASLNSDLVCPIVLDLLEDGQPWIIRAKALCVVEACIMNGGNGATNPYRDFFHACRDEIAPLGSHPRPAIHDPARRVMTLLGLDVETAPIAAPVAAAPVAAVPNLLDFDDEPPAPPAQAPPAPPVTSNGGGNMFGGMQIKSKVPSAPAPASVPAAPTSGNLLDLMGGGDATVSAPPSEDVFRAKPAESMFAQMNLKDSEDKKTDSEDAGDLSSLANGGPSGSAFGFINEAKPAPAPAPVAPQPTASTGSFDPLKGISPGSQKKMMQMSPEQMQAMAYQQMMYQQQMQQMAFMQQQQMGMRGMPMAGNPGMPMFPAMGMPQQQQQQRMTMMGAARPARQDDKKFDFVRDAMKTEGKK